MSRRRRRNWLATGITCLTVFVFASCGDDSSDPGAPLDPCTFSGITETDATGDQVGTVDPNDWCDDVYPARPNPTTGGCLVQFDLARDQHVRVSVRSASAGEIRVVIDQGMTAGQNHTVFWDGMDSSGTAVAPGIYCVEFESDDTTCTGDVEVQ